MTRTELDHLQAQIDNLRNETPDVDYLILAVGVRGPNLDCPEGNAIATVGMGHDKATSEAVHLRDAITLARGRILREREARKAKAKEAAA